MDAKLTLSRRDVFGKKARQLTEGGQVLGNIYGKGRESIAINGDLLVVEKVVAAAGKNHPITITLDDGEELMALVQDVERDYKTRHIHHVAFQEVIKGQKVRTEVPVRLVGEAPAARLGMIVVTLTDTLEVDAIPSKIPDFLEVSAEGLQEDGDTVHISDITVPEGVEIRVEDDRLIAKVETPRAQVEDTAEEEGEEGEADAAAVPSDHGSADSGEEDQKDES